MQAHPAVNLVRELPLWPEKATPCASPDDAPFPTLHYYLPSPEFRTGQTVLLLPGGGYGLVSLPKEGHRPAMWLSAHGIAAAVLAYRHAPQRYPVPLLDAQRAIRVLRDTARREDLDPDAVGAMGFSAGGHLCGLLATQPPHPDGLVGDAPDTLSCRPDFAALIYPVVSMCNPDTAHTGSRNNLVGPDAAPELLRTLSIDHSVSSSTPPCFLFHTLEDETVSPHNTLDLANALLRHGVPFACHIEPKGGHGIGIGRMALWMEPFRRWLTEDVPQL